MCVCVRVCEGRGGRNKHLLQTCELISRTIMKMIGQGSVLLQYHRLSGKIQKEKTIGVFLPTLCYTKAPGKLA